MASQAAQCVSAAVLEPCVPASTPAAAVQIRPLCTTAATRAAGTPHISSHANISHKLVPHNHISMLYAPSVLCAVSDLLAKHR
ncbi:hypothetical protein EON66_09370 [archaeon]|nr:MAG: hypothetical protein EON66_09370 [archaeon]